MQDIMSSPPTPKPVHCVGVICFRGDEVLLIRRGTAPRKGDWSIPGGRIETGETEADAALRELSEETSVAAILGDKIDTIKANFEGFDYVLHDYIAIWQSGDPVAGDDADEARFVKVTDIAALGMWAKTTEIIQKAYAHIASVKGASLLDGSR